MKKCPFCVEDIQSEAIKCRYCGEWLNDEDYINRKTGISTKTTRTEAGFSQKVEDYAAYFDRGLAYAKNGNYHQAIQDYGRAIELNPILAETYYRRGNLYVRLGNCKEAIQDYDKAIEINPKYAEAYCWRGIAYVILYNRNQATNDLRIAARLGNEEAQNILRGHGIEW
ncbi:MAG: tetratricopeptide repeat protein [Syntrophales bacterium]|jgi:tetratricopeptide (TPR) repeat protein